MKYIYDMVKLYCTARFTTSLKIKLLHSKYSILHLGINAEYKFKHRLYNYHHSSIDLPHINQFCISCSAMRWSTVTVGTHISFFAFGSILGILESAE